MADIRTTDPDAAAGELAAAYEIVRGARGTVANILQLLTASLHGQCSRI